MDKDQEGIRRYDRQMVFPSLGLEGQRRLMRSRALIVGVGGLGSWAAELLARAGVQGLRLVDNDRVDLCNLHRQSLYSQADADSRLPKVQAARRRISEINTAVEVEPVDARLDAHTLSALAEGMDLILDGTDNFATRFIINDFSVKTGRPWVFAGVVGAEAQVMPIVPGRTACLRCVYDSPPPPCLDPVCRAAGVLGPAVAAIASLQAMEALKILSGHPEQVSPYLLKMDLWSNAIQRIHTTGDARRADCACCNQRHFEFLEA